MAVSSPQIDPRTGPDIVSQLEELIKHHYAPEIDPKQGLAAALVGIFSRFAELIIERLNQVPEKNFLAFVDLLGASPLPPQPARAPLTFSLAAGSAVDGVVPARTQVASAPAEGEEAPVVFETERELVVTAAQVTSVFVRNPEQDKFADLSFITGATSERGVPIFLANRNIEHIVLFGHDTLFSHPGLTGLKVSLSITDFQPADVVWERWDGATWAELASEWTPASSPPLTGSGDVTFTGVSPFLQSNVAGIDKRWLRCRLTTPIAPSPVTPPVEAKKGMVRADRLPEITSVTITANAGQDGLPIDHAFANGVLLDATKDFLPFGDKPKLGDALYLSVNEAFSEADSVVTMTIDLSVMGRGTALLRWEYWDGAWKGVPVVAGTVVDGTKSLTQNGVVTFKLGSRPALKVDDGTRSFPGDRRAALALPSQPALTSVNGVEGYWIRARIISGNYGEEALLFSDPTQVFQTDATARLATDPVPLETFRLRLATYQPPLIKSISVKYELSKSGAPGLILTYNDFQFEDVTGAAEFKPFKPTTDSAPSLYLGFSLPPARNTFPNRKISLFSVVDEHKYGEKLIPVSPLRSRVSGGPGTTAVHKFVITNPELDAVELELEVTGTTWEPSVSDHLNEIPTLARIQLGPDPSRMKAHADPTASFAASGPRSKGVTVSVKVPASAPAGSSDRGYLTLSLLPDEVIRYTAVIETLVGEAEPANARVQLEWGYSSAGGYSKLLVRDESENFGLPGLVEFLGPPDFALRQEFGLDRYWLRSVWKSGQYAFEPLLHRLLLNTTMAGQRVTITNEVLGSSDGSKNQRFRAIQPPVLQGPLLEVREPELPSAAEQEQIRKQEGEDAISVVRDAADGSREIWVRWSEAPDFYGSAARDRHYVMDHLTGEIRFGDGQNGLIPPPGSGSVRLAAYQTGGGATGNKPAGAISQLKTTVPYVEKATNHVAATGGADAEKIDSLLEHAPRMIRHGGRAVTFEDFQDLAKLASPEVARAKCVPLRNLLVDPEGIQLDIGTVSLIVVPRSSQAKPLPGVELINRVRDFITRRQPAVADLIVVGPEYVRVSVDVEVAVASLEGAGEVELAVDRALTRFLHPLTGGLDGRGWDFGREPHRSDLYALIEDVPGVGHVRTLTVTRHDDRTGLEIKTETVAPLGLQGRFLVYSGTHKIALRFDEP